MKKLILETSAEKAQSSEPEENISIYHESFEENDVCRSIGTQTEDWTYPLTSTPIKNTHQTINSNFSMNDSNVESELDSEYVTSDCPSEIIDESNTDILNEDKFVVFEGMLDQLFKVVRCQQCHLPVADITKSKLGTSIHCKLLCENQHLIIDWKSQPLLGKLPAFNLLISASIFFSGSTYELFRKPASFAGLNFVNSNTYYNIQRTLIIPSINEIFNAHMRTARDEARSGPQVVLGDGRFDSPGKSAKYCTYTFQSPITKKIVATSTIQTTNGKGSAPLELKGFINCLEELETDEFNLTVVATDRNRQLAKWIRENRDSIEHCFDPWHFSKNIKAKLRKLIKRKGCKIIQEWIKPIGNHLFWCSENCNGDAETLRQMWQSVMEHISNKHAFKKKYPKYPKCLHSKYSKTKAKRKKWIKKGSAAYDSVEKVVMDKKNLKDMAQITKPYHTGSVEVFHSLINSYASKRQEFELNVMDARVKLAVIDHNSNINRKQAVVRKERQGSASKGEKQWKIVSSRLSKDWVAKEKKEPKSVAFVSELLSNVVQRKRSGEKIAKKVSEVPDRIETAKNIAYTERPEICVILDKHYKTKRFKQ